VMLRLISVEEAFLDRLRNRLRSMAEFLCLNRWV